MFQYHVLERKSREVKTAHLLVVCVGGLGLEEDCRDPFVWKGRIHDEYCVIRASEGVFVIRSCVEPEDMIFIQHNTI